MPRFFQASLTSNRAKKIWLLLYLLLVTGVVYILYADWAYDDPYITYRYARNIQQGIGFVFNSGERVLSTTTPLFTLLLAALSFVWNDIPKLALLISASSLALGGVFLWSLGSSLKIPEVRWTGLFLYPIFTLVTGTLGSETPLYIALCLGAIAFYQNKRYYWMAVFAALAVLARPDGLLVPLVLLVFELLRRRFKNLQELSAWIMPALLAGFLLLVWIAWAWWYFGSPIPVTLAAKQQQGAMEISQTFAEGFLTILGWYNKWLYLMEAVLAIFGLIYASWKNRASLLTPLWMITYFAAYSWLGVSRYVWYYAPLVPGFVVLVGLGIAAIRALLEWIGRQVTRKNSVYSAPIPSSLLHKAGVVLSLGLILALLVGQVRQVFTHSRLSDTRYPLYKATGEWLEQNTSPDTAIGMLEVGIIGYYCNRTIIDFVGLIQPAVALQLTPDSTYQDSATWAIDQYHPDYLVLHRGLFPNIEGETGALGCRLIHTFSGTSTLDIYSCDWDRSP